MTEIYVDVLLVINYVVNSFLLQCLAKCTGRKPKGSRLVAAAVVGSIGSLTIFLPFMGFFATNAIKLLLSSLMVRIVFCYRGWRSFMREWIVFFVISFFFAGAMLALWLIIKPVGMFFYNGVPYFDISAVMLVVMSAAAYALISLFWYFSRSGRIHQDIYDVKIKMGNRFVSVRALVDTGNSLYEPFSGTPVMICSLEDIAPLLGADLCEALTKQDYGILKNHEWRMRFICYNAVGGAGMLPAFPADKLTILQGNKFFEVENIFIAVATGRVGGESYSALLNPDLVEQKT